MKVFPYLARFGAFCVYNSVIRSKELGIVMSTAYGWQRCYQDAILETDRSRLQVLIRMAHAAIDARVEQLRENREASAEERQAIADALAGLRVLREEADSN